MKNRNGEKIGWIGGWIGAFIWLLVLAIIWFVRGETQHGAVAMGFFFVAMVVANLIVPWRYPYTKYWKLFLLPFIMFFVSVFICVAYGFGGESFGLQWENVFWLIPLMIPFFTLGSRTWNDENSS
jgi:hypothetical protein